MLLFIPFVSSELLLLGLKCQIVLETFVSCFYPSVLLFNHLSDGGVLALSTPNADGVSIKKNFDKYADKHPNDHYRIFSPKFMKKLLRKYGFRHIKVNITGIHPERMSENKSLLNNKLMLFMTKLFAKVFGLGDTFEIYAQK